MITISFIYDSPHKPVIIFLIEHKPMSSYSDYTNKLYS